MERKFSGLILALDLATVTGIAYGVPDKPPKFATVRFVKPGMDRARCHRAFRNWLHMRWADTVQPDLIVYESPATPMLMTGHTNIDTIKRLIGLAEHLEEWCYDRVELREASVQQVRAHFIGSNKNKRKEAKRITIERCHELGWHVDDDNQADACALWDYQVCCLRPDLAVRRTPLFA